MLNDHDDKLKLHGSMVATLVRANGDVQTTRKDNIIVDVGFDFICDALGLSASRPGVLSHIGVGTGTTAPAPTDAALQTQLVRAASTYSHAAGTKVFTESVLFAAGVATGAITEAGVFNAAAAGTMLDRVTFGAINKGALDTLAVTFTFTLS